MKLLAIDGNSIFNRAFYGIRMLSNKNGVYTNAIYGFLNILMKLSNEVQPDAVAVAFDLKAPTFRHKQYEGYKATRKGMPEELAMQLPYLKELLDALGYKRVEVEGYEADDILGTFAKSCTDCGSDCIIATGDRDSLQLVGEHVTVMLATTKMGQATTTVMDTPAVLEKYGVQPRQLIDVKALMGDSSDNIPGVAGIGEKTALSLIREYGNIQYIYDHFDEIELKPAQRTKLQKDREMAFLSRALGEICQNVPMDADPAHYQKDAPDVQKAAALFSELEMFTLMERFGIAVSDKTPVKANRDVRVLRDDGMLKDGKLYTKSEDGYQSIRDLQKVYLLCTHDGDDISQYAVCLDGSWTAEQKETAACWQTVVVSDDTAYLDQIIRNEAVEKIVFDCKALYRYALRRGLDVKNVAFDLLLAAYLLNPDTSVYDLIKLSLEYDIDRPQFSGDTQGMDEDFLTKAGVFCTLAGRMHRRLEQSEQMELLQNIEIPLSLCLADMELTGFELDTQGITDYGKDLETEIEKLTASIYELAGYEFNINSPKQLADVLFVKLGLPPKKKTKSGYSTNAEVLESLSEQHEIIPQILEYRKLAKLKSTYVDGLLVQVAGDGRVHTSFNQTETRTGRISSTEPNMQNIPVRTELGSRLRMFFRAKEGCKLIDADYSQIELRVLASIAKDQNMIEAFQNDEDIHTNTAAQVFDLPPLFVTPLMRSRAKAVNFGIVYGIGAFSLSKNIHVSVAEADSYIKNYLKTFGGVKQYMDDIIAFGRENGYVETLYHRRRYLGDLKSSNRIRRAAEERIALNTPIQGTAADIIKIAMVRVYQRLKKEQLKTKLILQIHDELILESPEKEVETAKRLLKEEMENAAQLAVHLDVDANVGENWYIAKG
ncbi:DNA polymerase I [Candidatus Soleaferrea massiliensis]|uniref:DNA polymerase I n=1 Tax=Candidatus Soleaferrea massiliensis TaxID=1470354 RepID=UPI00058D3567|nr:DNA polymerase I [Candidatus Soleaferrea massiliensis]